MLQQRPYSAVTEKKTLPDEFEPSSDKGDEGTESLEFV